MGRGGKVVFKRESGRGGGGGSGSWGRGARARRDDATDEEYVVGEEEDSSDDSYSSDASREASQDGSSSEEGEGEGEEEEEEECDWWDEEDAETAGGRRRWPRKGQSGSRRKPAARPLGGRRSLVTDEVGETGGSPIGEPRARRRQGPGILAEGEDDENNDDDDDEDFAPEEDEDDEEELTRLPVRKSSGRRNRPVKRQRRRTARKPQGTEKKRETTLVRKRRRTAPGSDDDDFIEKDRVSVDGAERKKRGFTSGRKRRRSLTSSPDPSDSDTSDADYAISEEELWDLRVGGALVHQERADLSSGVQDGEKGKGKEIDDVGKQVCGICLSEEHDRVIRGLLDCCAHYFCFACIIEWSKVESRCPVCKRRFKTVSKSARSDAGFDLRTAIIRIAKRDQVYQPSEEEIRGYLDPYANVVCVVCQQGGDDNLMLLCDICDSSAHTYCVGLGRDVPDGNWYCDGCRFTDPDSSNSRVQESAVERGTSNSGTLQEEFSGGVDSDNVVGCMSHGIPQQSSSLPCQSPPSQGTGQGTFIRCQSLAGDYGAASHVSGFAASTVSGRRSIHQRIRIILSNNRVRWIPGAARNDLIQSSPLESYGDMHHIPQESLINIPNERSSMSFPGPFHNEGSSQILVDGARKQVKSTVKRHLSHLTADTSLGRKEVKEIARHATHTILAACGFQHRQSMVTTIVQVPSNCVHLPGGDLASPVKGCCSSCFTSFVEHVVQEILDLKLRSA